MLEILTAIDWIVAGVAALLLLVITVRTVRIAPPRDLLAGMPDRPYTVGEDALALAVLVYLLAGATISALGRMISAAPPDALMGLFVGTGAQLAGLATCLFLVAGRFGGGIRRFLLGGKCFGPWRVCLVVPVFVLLALGLCSIVIGLTHEVVRFLLPGYEFKAHPTIQAMREDGQSPGIVIGLWIGAAVLAPIAEEVFFRGLLQTYLVGVLGSRWRAIGLASLAFAVVHVSQPHAIPALIVLSLLIGYAYERTGALMSPILIHAFFNLKTLVWSALGDGVL